MKQIFRKSAAMLLAVIMAVIAFPLSAQAAEQTPEPHIVSGPVVIIPVAEGRVNASGKLVPGYTITGSVITGIGSYAVMSISPKGGSSPVYQDITSVSGSKFNFGWVSFENNPAGTYIVTVQLLDNSFMTIASTSASVTHSPAASFTVTIDLILSGFGGVVVDTLTRTAALGDVLDFTPGTFIYNGYANYQILTVSVDGKSVPSGKVTVTGPIRISLTCKLW